MPSLMDRLQSLGVSIGTSDLPSNHHTPKKFQNLAEILGGEEVQTIYGSVIRIIKEYPLGFSHGQIACDIPLSTPVFREWANIDHIPTKKMFLFLDTETSGLSSGTGTFAFLVGIGLFTETHLQVIQYFLESPANEAAMLAQLINDISGTSLFITYNGKSFDIPLLRNRFILNRIEFPFEQHDHADLLHITRKLYKLFLPERNLGVVEKEILHFTRDELEVPGWMVPEIYAEFLRNQDPEPIKRVLYHNEVDIVSLAALYQHINNTLVYAENVDEKVEIPFAVQLSIIRLWLEHGEIEKAQSLFSSLSEPTELIDEYAKTAYMIGINLKQLGNPFEADVYWQLAAKLDNPFAFIELAKFYEHYHKEYNPALAFTLSAKAIISEIYTKEHTIHADIEKRIIRLQRLIQEELSQIPPKAQ
jgi:uncharacterized protein YprB with RNaseH-like and TPR domain